MGVRLDRYSGGFDNPPQSTSLSVDKVKKAIDTAGFSGKCLSRRKYRRAIYHGQAYCTFSGAHKVHGDVNMVHSLLFLKFYILLLRTVIVTLNGYHNPEEMGE